MSKIRMRRSRVKQINCDELSGETDLTSLTNQPESRHRFNLQKKSIFHREIKLANARRIGKLSRAYNVQFSFLLLPSLIISFNFLTVSLHSSYLDSISLRWFNGCCWCASDGRARRGNVRGRWQFYLKFSRISIDKSQLIQTAFALRVNSNFYLVSSRDKKSTNTRNISISLW